MPSHPITRRQGSVSRNTRHCENVQISHSPKILVVDDEPSILKGLRRLLGRRFQVETASSAEQAIDLVTSNSYHAVITDYDMPGHNGIWLLEAISEKAPQTRRVLHTGTNPDGLENHLESGIIQTYVPKPASKGELVEFINVA